MPYANQTQVSEARSRAEIEQVIRKYLGRGAAFSYGSMPGRAAIQFSAYSRQIRFELPLPSQADAAEHAGRHYKGRQCRKPTISEMDAWLEAEDRRRWRCLLLAACFSSSRASSKRSLSESSFWKVPRMPRRRVPSSRSSWPV